jgi:hypothetical protein
MRAGAMLVFGEWSLAPDWAHGTSGCEEEPVSVTRPSPQSPFRAADRGDGVACGAIEVGSGTIPWLSDDGL